MDMLLMISIVGCIASLVVLGVSIGFLISALRGTRR